MRKPDKRFVICSKVVAKLTPPEETHLGELASKCGFQPHLTWWPVSSPKGKGSCCDVG